MTASTIDRPTDALDDPDLGGTATLDPVPGGPLPPTDEGHRDVDADREPPVDLATVGRPLLAAGLASAAAALVTGGIFGSWPARLLALFAACFGVGWAFLTLRARARDRAATYQLLLVPAALAVSLVLMVPAGGGGPSNLPELVRDAITSGRTLRPPVPFDPGWIPILMVVFSFVGFGAAWVGTALDKQRLAIAIPLPLLALTAMTQPDDGEFIAGLCAFVPLVGALAVLFGGDGVKASQLTKDFELKRAARGLAATLVAVIALVVLSRANVLFPEPVYDPTEQPQKPKPIPLSAIEDVVLFEVRTDSPITGPWKTGVLDVYDGEAWRLPPFDKTRLTPIPPDGIVAPKLNEAANQVITFTIRGMENATSLPGVTGPVRLERTADLGVMLDPRTGTFRMPNGRIPPDATYSIATAPYPNAEALAQSPAPSGDLAIDLEIPEPPDVIRQLLSGAPAEPAWARLDFLRKRLREVAVATGGGVPKDITPARVAEILDGPTHEASPYEIVAAEAMLARWAGVPARIGFGFDGLNDEDGVMTVRPKNAAQWLEVYFEGHGWVPLIEAPSQAKTSLDNDDQLFDPDTLASDEVAVEIYVPVKLESLTLLYQRIRYQLLLFLPYALGLLAAYLATPAVMKQWRRHKRRKWAEGLGARAQVAVEYAEFRDQAHDLNVGDPLDTPLEYLKRVVDDDEHAELAWLVSRAMYGDLAAGAGDEAARDAEALATSLRRRMFRAQPFQVRVLAAISKASIRDPYTTEVPNVVLLDPLGRFARWRKARRLARRAHARTRPRRMLGPLPLPHPLSLSWRRS